MRPHITDSSLLAKNGSFLFSDGLIKVATVSLKKDSVCPSKTSI
ncbi:hypothetical protein NEIELOOT_02646 [Neisseria elongata subsp. glycolytica ATCC 29315]|uniref:Uncharacterized protein n=1 Tax=Neisseria elongata subsp. glycolytica ATCC 29315 TaxID=546263 RepID=D4DU87_NEIEG|nr:hypothetical protein NEIELOOT_02646 [Neisseria elongata subsp. glycolytica ATCC 29315]